ncbi:hypothetical protein ElyMa_002423200 [Elysia marginata]|uniref:Uncharacterized protein n=1 Tax=Elysia marginata TaxID=1093978 RepID=A0AAV4GJT4_9GAST|nr:hypothetical protein ElyMa_002423200 [Elysia marginata]
MMITNQLSMVKLVGINQCQLSFKTTAGPKVSPNGNHGTAKDHVEDRCKDGETISYSGKELPGDEMLDNESDGRTLRGAISCSGQTKPSRVG